MKEPRSPRLLGGFFYPFRGLRFLLRHPRLLGFVAIPVGINALLYTLLGWAAVAFYEHRLDPLLPSGDAWYWVALHFVLGLVFAVLLFFAGVYTFTLVGNLILAPFNALLSEKVEWIHSGNRLDEPFRMAALAADLVRSLKAEVGRMALYLGGFLVLLALNLFPPVGTAIYAVLLPVFTVFFLGWEYLDPSMERWQFPFGTKRKVVFGNSLSLLGFGAGAAALLVIPLLNLLAIPVCVVGGTLLYCDLRTAGRVPETTTGSAGKSPKTSP